MTSEPTIPDLACLAAEQPLRLPERLLLCAELWAAATPNGTLARLGRHAVNDSSFFNRIESPQGTTTATLERFARFLSEPVNWPDGVVPEEVCAFAHVVGITSGACAASPDTNPAVIAPPVDDDGRGSSEERSPIPCAPGMEAPSGRAPAASGLPSQGEPAAAGAFLSGSIDRLRMSGGKA